MSVAMVAALWLAVGLMSAPGAYAQGQYAPTYDGQETVTPTMEASLPETGSDDSANLALLAVLGAFALGVAGVALLSNGGKTESEA